MINLPQRGDPALGLEHKLRLCGDPSAPLLVMAHGRAGNYDVMWTFARCAPEPCNIIAPQAFLPDPIGGFSWWLVDGMSAADVTFAAERLQSFIESAVSSLDLRPRKLVAYGFSQGAGLLSVLVQSRPRWLNGLALLAGFVIKSEAAVTPPSTRILMAHGSRDPVVSLAKARSGSEILKARGFEVELVSDDVEHKVGAGGMRRLKEWSAGL